MSWWIVYLAVAAVAFGLGLLLTFAARGIGRASGFVDRPHRERHKQHQAAVSMLGGAAIFAAVCLTIAIGFIAAPAFSAWLAPGISAYLPGRHAVVPRLIVILGSGFALLLFGLADDWRPMPAYIKFSGQTVIAALTALQGVRVTLFFSNPILTFALTVMWIVFVINAINFFDNMDALAAGTVAIAALLFLSTAVVREQFFVALLAASTLGAVCGFLAFNWPPASVFMGDSGSHVLGYLLAVIGAMTTFYTPHHSPTLAPLFIPLLVLALPIFDIFAVVIIRHRQQKPLHVGDLSHISHRFVRMGLSRPRAVLIIHLLSFSIGAGALSLLWLPTAGALVVLAQAAALLALVTALHTAEIRSRPEADAENGGQAGPR